MQAISNSFNFNTFHQKLVDLANGSSSVQSKANRLARYSTKEELQNTILNILYDGNLSNTKSKSALLDDIDNFFETCHDVDNAAQYFDEMLQSVQKFKGGAFGLEILSNPPPGLNGLNLKKFEATITEGDKFRFDLLYESPVDNSIIHYIETKNYALTTSFSTSFYKQFSAYISKIDDLNKLKYYFRANTGITKLEQVNKFKSMLNSGNNKVSLFQGMSTDLRTSILGAGNENNFNLFSDLINQPNSTLYDFIEIF